MWKEEVFRTPDYEGYQARFKHDVSKRRMVSDQLFKYGDIKDAAAMVSDRLPHELAAAFATGMETINATMRGEFRSIRGDIRASQDQRRDCHLARVERPDVRLVEEEAATTQNRVPAEEDLEKAKLRVRFGHKLDNIRLLQHHGVGTLTMNSQQ